MTKIEHGSMILQGVINFPKKTIIHSPIVAELIATLSWRYMDQSIERGVRDSPIEDVTG